LVQFWPGSTRSNLTKFRSGSTWSNLNKFRLRLTRLKLNKFRSRPNRSNSTEFWLLFTRLDFSKILTATVSTKFWLDLIWSNSIDYGKFSQILAMVDSVEFNQISVMVEFGQISIVLQANPSQPLIRLGPSWPSSLAKMAHLELRLAFPSWSSRLGLLVLVFLSWPFSHFPEMY